MDYQLLKNDPNNFIDLWGLKIRYAFPCTADKACKLAKEENEDNGDYGGVICSKGKHIPCVWTENINKTYNNVITYNGVMDLYISCIKKHEEFHIANKDISDCVMKNCACFQSRTGLMKTECGAYKAGIDCLKKGKESTCLGNNECESQVDKLINDEKSKALDKGCVIF